MWKRYDFEFHHALISACGSNALLETHAPVYNKYLRYQMIAGIFRGEIAAREHHKLMECALSRDAAAACEVLLVHIEACVDFTLAMRVRSAFRLGMIVSCETLRETVHEPGQLLLGVRLDLQVGADGFQDRRLARLHLGQQLRLEGADAADVALWLVEADDRNHAARCRRGA